MRILTKKDEEKMKKDEEKIAILLLQMQDTLHEKKGYNVNSIYDKLTACLRDIAKAAGSATYSQYAIGMLNRERA